MSGCAWAPGGAACRWATCSCGALLVAMGLLTMVLAINGPSMPTSGWRVTLAADLQHAASVATKWLAWLPGWAVALAAAAGLILLICRARRSATPAPGFDADPETVPTPVGPASCAVAADHTSSMETATDGR